MEGGRGLSEGGASARVVGWGRGTGARTAAGCLVFWTGSRMPISLLLQGSWERASDRRLQTLQKSLQILRKCPAVRPTAMLGEAKRAPI